MNTVWSTAYCGETAMPSRPPSPVDFTSSMVCTGVTVSPSAPAGIAIFMMRWVSRSVASAVPSGRNASAHGTFSPCAITLATALGGVLSSEVDGGRVGRLGGPPASVSLGGPNAHPASRKLSTAHSAMAGDQRRGRGGTASSLAGAHGPAATPESTPLRSGLVQVSVVHEQAAALMGEIPAGVEV